MFKKRASFSQFVKNVYIIIIRRYYNNHDISKNGIVMYFIMISELSSIISLLSVCLSIRLFLFSYLFVCLSVCLSS